MRPRSAPGDGLLHPLVVGAVLLLVVNDHWLKQAYGNALTGKLSDFAGLCFFPVLLQAGYELSASRLGVFAGPSRRALLWAAALTALSFTLVKMSPACGTLYQVGLASLQWPLRAGLALASGAALPGLGKVALTPDLTDLWALVAIGAGLACVWRRAEPEPQRT